MIVVTLRERLRQDTRTAHDAMDRALARFDLAGARGRTGFLVAQRDGAAALSRATPGGDPLREALDAALADLDADLAALGHDAPPARLGPPALDHPLARTHMWLSNRLGTRMLAGRMAGDADPRAAAAGRFIARAAERSDWRPVADALDAMSGRGREADAVLRAVRDWFALYEHAAVTAMRRVDVDA